MRYLLRNSCRTPDGTELVSKSRHDYATYTDVNGETYMRDGGISYIRCNINRKFPSEDTSLYTGMAHSMLRNHLMWGTYSIGGDDVLRWIKIKDMETSHIYAVLGLPSINKGFRVQFKIELRWREYEN